jgi:hypothetical protein
MSTKAPPDPYDGTLFDWSEIEQAEDWDALILGNGMSINLWGDFKYDSLYEEAKDNGFLSKQDRKLFKQLGVTNFEEVLRKLSNAIVVGEAIGEERPTEEALHASIQKALAQAIQSVHVEQSAIPLEHLEAIRAELRHYRFVFTTSYDLIVYWASGKGPDPAYRYAGFCDFLWADDQNAFDESTITLPETSMRTRLYFLHGALHLVVLGDGTTCKNTASFLGLLNKFGLPFRGDHTARPLIITEASAHDKLRSINANDYLSYCWRTLGEIDCPVVIFGHSLSEQDRHLVDALNEHDGPLAISLTGGNKKRTASEQHRIASLFPGRKLYFFRASTHPLGAKELRIKKMKAPFWKPKTLGRVA